jgi:hypothetical protein
LTTEIIIAENSIKANIIIAIPPIFEQRILDLLDKVLYIHVPSLYFAYEINLETVLTVLNVKL